MPTDPHRAAIRVFLLLSALTTGQHAMAQTRDPSGAPGPAYWQSRVDYDVAATLDPRAHTVSGSARITYHNASPDTLREIHWHLYQNLFRKDSPAQNMGTIAGRPVARTRGIRVRSVTTADGALTPRIDGTLMRTPLARALAPHDSLVIDVAWDYEVPRIPSIRTGSKGNDFAIGQWYPQISTYDDIRGWNDLPYRGPAEFYLEYGRWTAKLTVPAGYVVAATGMLQNADEVLSDDERRRLASAASAARGTTVQVTDGRKRPSVGQANRTWIFHADSVRDFVWAASPRFAWQATRTAPTSNAPRGVLIQTYYPRGTPRFREAAQVARDVVELYGRRFGEYPYPQLSVLSGPVSGIEYPMLVFTAPGDPFTDLFTAIIAHEVGHQWYPMVVGTDESRSAFLDEGTATFMTSVALEAWSRESFWNPEAPSFIRAIFPPTSVREIGMNAYVLAARGGGEVPITTPPDSMSMAQIGVAAYEKPGAVLRMLRDVVGDSAFYGAMNAFFTHWRFRHPRAEDFFATFDNITGMPLGWFWDAWYRSTAVLDLGVSGVGQDRRGAGWSAVVQLENRGGIAMPATLRLTLADRSVRDVRVNRSVWMSDSTPSVRVDDIPAEIREVVVDPNLVLADVDRRNNHWPRAPQAIDARPTLLGDMFPPTDKYRVGVLPVVWYNAVDGAELGLSGTRSYLGQVDRLSGGFSVGAKTGRIDGRLAYRSTTGPFGAGHQYALRAFSVDGRAGGAAEFEWKPRAWGNLIAHEEARRQLHATLMTTGLLDSAYLPFPANWTNGWISSARLRLIESHADWFAAPWLSLLGESGISATHESFSKGAAELRLTNTLPKSLTASLRATVAWASRNTPPQTAWYLAGGAPLDELESSVLRSKGMESAIGWDGRARRGGGGAVFGADRDLWGRQMAAANGRIEFQGIGLFGDVGRLWQANRAAGEQWIADAGFFVGVQLPSTIGQLHLPNLALEIDAPMWLSRPAPDDAHAWDPKRRRLVLGARWGTD
jgi:hypothetical protein